MESWFADGVRDLLLGGACVSCAHPGRVWCRACDEALPTAAHQVEAALVPAGLPVPAWAAAGYGGSVRAAVIGHKERQVFALVTPLAAMLANAVRAAVDAPVLLVPVPSRRASTRARGHDPLGAIVSAAAARLGRQAEVAALLRMRHGVADQSGLDLWQRAANQHHAMWCPPGQRGRVRRALDRDRVPRRIVICDDVLTTGATAREAVRALGAVGIAADAIAVIAATAKPGSTSRN